MMEGKSKLARKIAKKQHRYQSMLLKDAGIHHSDTPMQYLMICNAGLVSGIQYEDIVNICSRYGSLEEVVMVPGKSYCFVVYHEIKAAELAHTKLNGIEKLIKMDGPMYLLFCQGVPKVKNTINMGKLPEGLTLLEDFVTEEEEEKLLSCVCWEQLSDNLGKVMKHRRVKHYGFEFRYDNNNVDKDKPLLEKIPQECDFINKRLEEKGFGTLLPWIPDQLTVNQYQRGQGIPSHIDTHSAFESPILSLSLGSDVIMEFKLEDEHIPVFLPRRSLLVMDGPARYCWSHGITPRTMDVISVRGGLTVLERKVRTSFTFRRVRQAECTCCYRKYCDSWSPGAEVSEDVAAKLEKTYVHEIYDSIASHFSDTRSKPWPKIRTFIESFSTGSVIVDVGCGNGKYFGLNKNIFEVGCDHSKGLAKVANDRGHQVFICNCLQLPLRSNIADGVISIAVLHHFANKDRRFQALQEIVRVLCPGGKALIYVWAKEQNKSKMSSYLKQDRKNRRKQEDVIRNSVTGTTIKQTSLEESVDSVGDQSILESEDLNTTENRVCGTENVNTGSQSVTPTADKSQLSVNFPIHTNRTDFQHSDLLVPWKMKNSKCKDTTEDPVFLRFYHVFEEGELGKVCCQLSNININEVYYDDGNWCIVFKKKVNH